MLNARRTTQALLFVLLVAIGVVGRWGQPEFAVTPIAAIGLLAGYALPRRVAVFVPLTAMLVSDLALPSYRWAGVSLAVYAAMAAPVFFGGWLRRPVQSAAAGIGRLVGFAAAPAVLFFVTTNVAVWACTPMYPTTLAGLGECYAAAVPFFKQRLVGDLGYSAAIFTAAWMAGAYSLRGLPAPQGELAPARAIG